MNVYRGGPVWFTCPVNVAGLPALSLPAGFNADGLPVGVQLVGKPDGEETLFAIGAAFQQLTDYHTKVQPPPTR
jgi:aspartyl-tRNA(Asn)/glutamyl-tRNA(Gln) amidotransferase subunit A